MLYIKDYGNLNALVSLGGENVLLPQLRRLKGRAATVWFAGGPPGGFTGVLTAFPPGGVKLLIRPPSAPGTVRGAKRGPARLGRAVVIAAGGITAVVFNTV